MKKIKLTKEAYDNEEYEVEEGMYIFMANSLKDLLNRLRILVEKRRIPINIPKETIDHVAEVTKRNKLKKKPKK